jgi:hypothetical protein
MSRLRVAEQGEQGARKVLDAGQVAVEVAADAALTRGGWPLISDQLDVLEAAARFAGHSWRELDKEVVGAGACADENPEKWYPVYREDPARREGIAEERLLARDLCDGCPVRGQCLALDYAQSRQYGHPSRDGVQHIWGIRAGLGARDRRALLPLWTELVGRLTAATVAEASEPTVAVAETGTTRRGIAKGELTELDPAS